MLFCLFVYYIYFILLSKISASKLEWCCNARTRAFNNIFTLLTLISTCLIVSSFIYCYSDYHLWMGHTFSLIFHVLHYCCLCLIASFYVQNRAYIFFVFHVMTNLLLNNHVVFSEKGVVSTPSVAWRQGNYPKVKTWASQQDPWIGQTSWWCF